MGGDREHVNGHAASLPFGAEVHDGGARGARARDPAERVEHVVAAEREHRRERRVDPLGGNRVARAAGARARAACAGSTRRRPCARRPCGRARRAARTGSRSSSRRSRARRRASGRAPASCGPSAASSRVVDSDEARDRVGLRAPRPAPRREGCSRSSSAIPSCSASRRSAGPRSDQVRARDQDRRRDPEERKYRETLGVVRDLRRPEHARRHGEEVRLQDRSGYDVGRGQRLAGLHALDRGRHVRRPAAAVRVDQEEREALGQRRRHRLCRPARAGSPCRGASPRGRRPFRPRPEEELDRRGPRLGSTAARGRAAARARPDRGASR